MALPRVQRGTYVRQIQPRPEQNKFDPTTLRKLSTGSTSLDTRLTTAETALALLNQTGTTTPTPTSSVGAFTTVSATVHYQKNGKWVHMICKLTVTTLGTAAGVFLVPLPFTAAAHVSGPAGGIVTSSGVGLSVYINPSDTNVNLLKATAATPGATVQFGITYEAAA